jgi:predicted ATPase/DNA-binding winged helix-turn-helix (wHTH) protein
MTIYALGPFRLDTQDGLLFRGIDPAALGGRAIALLRALVERPGALISKAALIEAAWPGKTIEDSNLTVQIAALRRVLSEAPGGGAWLETMPRRGYRFIGPVVTEVENSVMAAPPADTASAPPPTPHNTAERCQVTAMSCELIGMSGRADGVGLEDLREAVVAFQSCVAEIVGRHKGFIASRQGNTLLVLFGYPAAHEHDAEFAVRAGGELCTAIKALRSAAGEPAGCRIGIATGMVIIGESAVAHELWPREIVGIAPILAAWLQRSAPPDAVVIDPATRRLIGNLFDCRDLGTIETTRGTGPVHFWRVLGECAVESRFAALHGPALSPLVGRDEEVDLLLRRWVRAKTGDGQVVLISGEPGIGKSRIAAELEERLSGEPHLRLRYVCSPHHQDSALFPVIDELGRRAGFGGSDPSALKQAKLEALLTRTALPEEDAAFLAELLSLPASDRHKPAGLSPQRKKARSLEALLRQLEALARQQPLLMVFEDAHWIDPTSRELLDLIVERTFSLPVLLLVTFRPEFQPTWTGQPHVTMLALNRLDRRDRSALIERIAGGKTLPDEVVARIADRTDGIPLFVEELTKSLLESGVLREEPDRYVLSNALPPLAIPTTLHASLLARLERLASVRLVAQIGAAIGREFSYELLRRVSRLAEDELRTALGRLVASELVFQRGALPDAVYVFKHALVQDAAHASLLRGTRQQLHAQIAEALVMVSSELVDTQPELFAHHYAEAGLVEKSVRFWDKARRRSAARSAMAEASTQLQKGLEQLALLPDTPERQRQELEFCSALGAVLTTVKGYAAAESGQTYARARELWEQLGSPSEFLQVPFGQSRHHLHRGELDVALRLDEDLLRLSRQRGDSAGLILGHLSAGRNLMYAGSFARSRLHLEAVPAAYDPIAHRTLVQKIAVPPQVVSRAFLGIVLFCLGHPNQALAQNAAAIAEARGLAQPPSLAAFLSIGTILLSLVGDNLLLGRWAEELGAIASEYGFPYWQGQATIMGGWVTVRNGNISEGTSLLHSGLAAYRAVGTQNWMPHYTALLAVACEIGGQTGEGLTLLDDALRIVEATGQRWVLAELYRGKGQMLRRQGQSVAAKQLYRQALSTAEQQGAKLWELRAAVSLAELTRDEGRPAAARDLLAPVYGRFTEGFDTPDLIQAKALLDELI